METSLRAIGQTIALLGPNHHDPHLQPNGKLIFALKWQFQSYEKVDLPPTHIAPLPVELIKLAVQACCASNTEKDTCWHDHDWIFLFMLPWWTRSDIWQQALQVIECPILPRWQTGTHTVLWAIARSGFSNTYLRHIEEWCKRWTHWPQTFYLCNTLPHTSSSPPGGPSQFTWGKPTPTTVFLLPYSK